jgi:hypothetical protein
MTVVVDEVEVVPTERAPGAAAATPAAPDPTEIVRRTVRETAVRRARADRLRAY